MYFECYESNFDFCHGGLLVGLLLDIVTLLEARMAAYMGSSGQETYYDLQYFRTHTFETMLHQIKRITDLRSPYCVRCVNREKLFPGQIFISRIH